MVGIQIPATVVALSSDCTWPAWIIHRIDFGANIRQWRCSSESWRHRRNRRQLRVNIDGAIISSLLQFWLQLLRLLRLFRILCLESQLQNILETCWSLSLGGRGLQTLQKVCFDFSGFQTFRCFGVTIWVLHPWKTKKYLPRKNSFNALSQISGR